MKKIRSIFAILTIAALMFTSIPVMTGTFNAHAASVKKPVKVTGLKKYAVGTNYVHFQWNKIKKNKNTKGYAIYLNGKLYKRVGVKTYRYKIPKLKSNTSYKINVRAYNTYKQKQYYNTKTKKWQTKKPAKKNWKGKKTRKVTAYAYGPASATLSLKTTKPASQQTASSSHKHSYTIPVYGDAPVCRGYSFIYCPDCDFQRKIYDDEPNAASLVSAYGVGKHAQEIQDYYTKTWKEEHEYLALSDNVYDRVRYWEEYNKFIEEEVVPIDPYWNCHSVGVVINLNEIIGYERGVVAYSCSCGSKHYVPAPATIDNVNW